MTPSGVFVYGTLKRGGWNHHRVAHAASVQSATTRGTLYHLPKGYPAMTLEGDDTVRGEFLTFDDLPRAVRFLDGLEEYREDRPAAENRYLRVPIRVTVAGGKEAAAWGYVFPEVKAKEMGGKRLADGTWEGSPLLWLVMKPARWLQWQWHRLCGSE